MERGSKITLGVLGGLMVLAGGAYGVGYAMAGDHMPKNAQVAGVPIGGLTRAEAETKLRGQLEQKADAELTITAADQQINAVPADLGLGVDYAASVAQAGGEQSLNPVIIWQTLTGGGSHDPIVTTDQATLDAKVGELAQKADRAPKDAALAYKATTPTVTDGVVGVTVDRAATASAVKEAYLASTTVNAVAIEVEPAVTTDDAQKTLASVAKPAVSGPITLSSAGRQVVITPAMVASALTFTPDNGELKANLDSAKLDAAAKPEMAKLGLAGPTDAKWAFSDGKPVVVPHKDGQGVTPEALTTAVQNAMTKESGRTGTLPVVVEKAAYTTTMAQGAGVKEVTGEFTTKFPITKYRLNNIGKSAGLVNGVYLKPGDVFDMNKLLGQRTIARGWMAGGAIDGGKVVERMGGGISQTTTTVYNASYFAGLEDIVHKPHSLWFNRYPMGREATLDWYSVQMRFRNDSKYGVLMQAWMDRSAGTVTVRVWSTKVYDIVSTKPVQSNFRAPAAPKKDPSPVCSPQSAKTGFTVRFNRQFWQNGKLVKTEPQKWTYNSLQAVTCTNPNARPDRQVR